MMVCRFHTCCQSWTGLRDYSTSFARGFHTNLRKINFHTSTSQQIDEQHGPIMKFLAKWKGGKKGAPQKEMTSKGKYGKGFWNWSSFAWLRTVRCLWRALQGGSAKLECCKLPWLHQPARCEKLYTMWDIMPIWSMIIMNQYDPMILKLSASEQVCPFLDVWGKSRIHNSKRYTRRQCPSCLPPWAICSCCTRH